MIIVHVEHFLNKAGQEIFSAWLEEGAEALRAFQGFITIQALTHVEHPTECHLLLKFESLALLRTWASSDEHDRLIEKLAPYRNKKQRSIIFEAGKMLS